MSTLLVPANHYTIEQLAGFYNETRVDYMVPMPMNEDRLAEYIHDFDVNLEHSFVAVSDGKVAGLGMLGIRKKISWVTRLGVVPQNRRHGIGELIMSSMLSASHLMGMENVNLEVIKGNERAISLFRKYGFEEKDEYLVLRRAPSPSKASPQGKMSSLDRNETLRYMQSAPRQTWINEFESMANTSEVYGMSINLEDGSQGWIIYRKNISTLTHIILHTDRGNPEIVGNCLLQHLHFHCPRLDTYAENIKATDPHVSAFFSMGYFEAFQRIEMIRPL